MEVNKLDQTETSTITQSMFCNNYDYDRLRLYFIILVVLFLLALLCGTILHIDSKTIIEQNSKILTELKYHQKLYNRHIDNSIGYIQRKSTSRHAIASRPQNEQPKCKSTDRR